MRKQFFFLKNPIHTINRVEERLEYRINTFITGIMIEYIKGELTELTPAMATVEAAGVGYGLNISLTTYSALQGIKPAANGQLPIVKLYVYEAIVF